MPVDAVRARRVDQPFRRYVAEWLSVESIPGNGAEILRHELIEQLREASVILLIDREREGGLRCGESRFQAAAPSVKAAQIVARLLEDEISQPVAIEGDGSTREGGGRLLAVLGFSAKPP